MAACRPAVFLSVFKWETCKGPDVLLDAYLNEFTGGDPVELHIMTKPFGTDEDVCATSGCSHSPSIWTAVGGCLCVLLGCAVGMSIPCLPRGSPPCR